MITTAFLLVFCVIGLTVFAGFVFKRTQVYFAWNNWTVGILVDVKKSTLTIRPVPMIGIVFFRKKKRKTSKIDVVKQPPQYFNETHSIDFTAENNTNIREFENIGDKANIFDVIEPSVIDNLGEAANKIFTDGNFKCSSCLDTGMVFVPRVVRKDSGLVIFQQMVCKFCTGQSDEDNA